MTSSSGLLYTQGETVKRAFQFLFQCSIFKKVNEKLGDMNDAWGAQISEKTPFCATDAISYINRIIHIVAETDQDNVVTFMSSVVSKTISAETDEGLLEKKICCIRIASKFESARRLMLRRRTSLDCANIPDEEPCSGEAYLMALGASSKDIAELRDFIVCKPGKDYPRWLRIRAEYRFKRRVRLAKRQRKRKMKAYCSSFHQGRVKL